MATDTVAAAAPVIATLSTHTVSDAAPDADARDAEWPAPPVSKPKSAAVTPDTACVKVAVMSAVGAADVNVVVPVAVLDENVATGCSALQSALQPSPLTAFPSSHSCVCKAVPVPE